MKQFFFFFAMLAGVAAFAQTGTFATQPLSANYSGATPTVTFSISWLANSRGTTGDKIYNNRVWVVVDYRTASGNNYTTPWTRAHVTTVPVVNSSPASTAELEPGNDNGFWLNGAAGAYSATVTVPLTGVPPLFGWCVNVIDRPARAVPTATPGVYRLYGTAPFVVNHSSHSSSTYSGACITSLTDASHCPGEFPTVPAITSFTANITTICAGQSVTLTAVASNAASYSFNGGSSWTTSSSVTVTPSTNTTYNLVVKPAGGCTVAYTTPIAVTVHPTPVPAFVSVPDITCNSVVELTAVDGLNSSSYCFTNRCSQCAHANPYVTGTEEAAASGCDFDDAQCMYTADNTYHFNTVDAGSVTVWLRVKNQYGCVDSTSTTVVNDAPVVNTVSSPNVEPGNATTLTCTMSGGTTTAMTYTWTIGGIGSNTSTATTYLTPVFMDATTKTYTVTATNTNNCSSAISAVGTVTVVPTGAGTQTWTCGTQTWSGALKRTIGGIAATTDLGTTNPPSSCMYRSSGIYSGSGYLYNWICVQNNATTKLCESPWRVPTQTDFINLSKCYGGSGNNEINTTVRNKLLNDWGSVYGGIAKSTTLQDQGTFGVYGSSSICDANYWCSLYIGVAGEVRPQDANYFSTALSVRCVK